MSVIRPALWIMDPVRFTLGCVQLRCLSWVVEVMRSVLRLRRDAVRLVEGGAVRRPPAVVSAADACYGTNDVPACLGRREARCGPMRRAMTVLPVMGARQA